MHVGNIPRLNTTDWVHQVLDGVGVSRSETAEAKLRYMGKVEQDKHHVLLFSTCAQDCSLFGLRMTIFKAVNLKTYTVM